MTLKKDQDPEAGFNQRIPGTGGDFIDEQDVEGHRAGPTVAPEPDDIYTSRTSGQGEFIRRGPDDNPHGER